MSAVQPRRLPLDHKSIEHEQHPYLRVQIDECEQHNQFIDYLHRLGCTVDDRGAGILDVRVTYPETVDDEATAIAEWCASWSTAHAPARAIVTRANPGAATQLTLAPGHELARGKRSDGWDLRHRNQGDSQVQNVR